MEAKRVALVDAIGKYRAAEKAQRANGASNAAPSPAVTKALVAVREAETAFQTAHQAFSEAQDMSMVVTVPTAKLRGAAAQLDKATEDRVKTHVLSPGDGWVSDVRIRPGAVMNAGMPAFPLVESGPWWVNANFKETDLQRIRKGSRRPSSWTCIPATPSRVRLRASAPAPAPFSRCCRRRTPPATG
ncbi:hypothetical protein AUC70_13395 [Methyloceanibacter stevinii]|uniref:Uncharacterized protein n=1 Tax=Methyloceanibacter stevinii TaxID=1774970 RepID=A0A1E3VVE1_9HYPH|nr:hypothetical protein AUC70_13395 [Methyloceanibacter stevinii]